MITELQNMHPTLLSAIVKDSTGIVGEHLVAKALRKRGHDVRILANNSRERDLVVGERTVEVKTVRSRSTWFVRKRPSRADVWVLVRLPGFEVAPIPTLEQAEMWVYSLADVQALWDANPYNAKNPTQGDIRAHMVRDEHRDAWQAFASDRRTHQVR